VELDLPIKKYIKLGVVGLIGIAVASFVFSWVTSPLEITLNGTGEINAAADKATISFTLSTSDSNSGVAAQTAKANAQNMQAYLESIGVPKNDIVESQVRVVPESTVTPGGNGYRAIVSLGFNTTNVSEISNLISSLYERGAVLVTQPLLQISNEDEQNKLENEALQKAIRDAGKQAASLGNKRFKFIRKLTNVSFSPAPLSSSLTSNDQVGEDPSKTSKFGSDGAVPGVSSNTIKISRTVSATFRMW
jgi:uncharacterized protein YggE